ncbi:hypothetical protein J8I29_25620 [Labrys sp. LIt4]|uniref:hypothetical protein n=1 Tax=Labrys sp. LIt4 TaxID=2821355 RepID=UPI001AE0B7FA|nr:hypothetical protein [Labrys sp. LIt4]MBP0582730.1 hypothetical protein [Labrys sp. LIt4]
MTFNPYDPSHRYGEPPAPEPLRGQTTALPLTASMRSQLREAQSPAASGPICAIAFVICLLLISFLGLWPTVMASGTNRALTGVILAAASISPYVWLRIKAGKDLGAGNFLRYSGDLVIRRHVRRSPSDDDRSSSNALSIGGFEVTLGDEGSLDDVDVTWWLKLPEGEFRIDEATARAAQDARTGEVDYAPQSKLIFEIRNWQGAILYRR